MPIQERHKTKYPGVYFIYGASSRGAKERIFYIYYRKKGKVITEKAGRQFQDGMTPARAASIRSLRIEGKELSNKEQREEIKKQKQDQANKWTMSVLWKEYKKVNAIKSLKIAEHRFNKYLQQLFGEKEPCEIAATEVDRLRINLLKNKKPGTVAAVLELLRRLSNFACKRNLCEGLKFTIKMPPCHNEKTEDLTSEQLKKLLQVLDADLNREVAAFMKMALFTGMRRGELFKLKWDDIDFDRKIIHIRDPKSGKDEVIPLNDGARQLLEKLEKKKTVFIFPGRKGKQRTDIKRAANRIKTDADLPKGFRPLHGLRHVYASMLASSGQVDMYTLQKLLTHKSPAMTQRYAHLRDETLKQASNLAGELINQATNPHQERTVITVEK